MEEARESARALMAVQGFDAATADALFAIMPDEGFLRFRPEQIAWQASALRNVRPGETRGRACAASPTTADALEVFVHSPDRDGLFAAILATLDRMGFGIHQARVLDGPHGTIFDTFEVLPADGHASSDPAEVEAVLGNALDGPLDKVRTSRRAHAAAAASISVSRRRSSSATRRTDAAPC